MSAEIVSFLNPRDPPTLTPKEVLVADCLPNGMTTNQIAEVLGIAPDTVKVHLRSVMRKLGARNRVQAAIIVYQQKLSAAQ